MTTRRQFLHTTAALAGALSLPGFAADAPPTQWKPRLAASSIAFSSLPIEQACERVARLGFEAIDIWCPYAKCPHLDDAQTRLGPAGLKELLAKHKLKLCSFSVYVGGYPKYAQLLGEFGGGIAVRGSTGPVKPEELSAKMKTFLESLKPELDLCEKHNSYLAIENHGNALLHTLDSFKAFADLNQHPRLGLAIAPYHLQTINASIEEAINIAGKQLLFFYAWQNARGVEQLPGHGPADMKPWLAALAKINYPHHITPFLHHEPDPDTTEKALAKAKEYLEKITP